MTRRRLHESAAVLDRAAEAERRLLDIGTHPAQLLNKTPAELIRWAEDGGLMDDAP